MDEELFTQLYESVKQMDEIVKGKRKPSREKGDVLVFSFSLSKEALPSRARLAHYPLLS